MPPKAAAAAEAAAAEEAARAAAEAEEAAADAAREEAFAAAAMEAAAARLEEEAAAKAAEEEAAARAAEEEAAARAAEEEEAANMTLKLDGDMANSGTVRNAKTIRAETLKARQDWMDLGESVKPDHLRVPSGVAHIVDRLIKPVRLDPEDVVIPPPRHGTGPLVPLSTVDPTVVRSFVHRIDRNHDDLVEPVELADLAVRRKLPIQAEQIQSMFERIMEARAPGKRHNVGISWLEIYNEVKVAKCWMKTTDIEVTCQDGSTYHVANEEATLERWLRQLYVEFYADYPELEEPTSFSPPDIDRQLQTILCAKHAKTGKSLQSEGKVQALLKKQDDLMSTLTQKPNVIIGAFVASQRQAWGWESQPYRSLWLRFFKAAGLKPLSEPEEVSGKQAALADERAMIVPAVSRNVANRPKKLSHATNEGQVKVREPKPKVFIRENRAAETNASILAQQAEPPLWYDEKRADSESLVNSTITKGILTAALSNPDAAPDAGYPDGSTSAPVAVSFDARRRFLQVSAKQSRDSEQQRSIGKDKQAMARQQSLLGQAGATVANVGVTFRGPHGHLGFSHHHMTNSVEPSRLKYEKELGHSWGGTHIDHTREEYQKEEVRLSKMDAEERARQFGTYFKKDTNQAARVDALHGAKEINDDYKSWQIHEFRADAPHRHGKYGRRIFDAQVRENEIQNKISGIDSKPMEEFNRQTDLVTEFLDRSLPANQNKHFENYLPRAEFAYRKEVDLVGNHMTGNRNLI